MPAATEGSASVATTTTPATRCARRTPTPRVPATAEFRSRETSTATAPASDARPPPHCAPKARPAARTVNAPRESASSVLEAAIARWRVVRRAGRTRCASIFRASVRRNVVCAAFRAAVARPSRRAKRPCTARCARRRTEPRWRSATRVVRWARPATKAPSARRGVARRELASPSKEPRMARAAPPRPTASPTRASAALAAARDCSAMPAAVRRTARSARAARGRANLRADPVFGLIPSHVGGQRATGVTESRKRWCEGREIPRKADHLPHLGEATAASVR